MHELTAKQPKRVLVVEDDADTARYLQLNLETPEAPLPDGAAMNPEAHCVHGQWIVTCADSLHLAVGLLHQNTFDVVLLDLILPDATGESVTNIIHEAAPDVPLVVHSGLDDADMVRHLLAREIAVDYLVKGDRATVSGCALKQRLCHAIDRFHVMRDSKIQIAAFG